MGRCMDDCGNGIVWIILILLLSGCFGGCGCGCGNNGCSNCG